MLTENVQFRQCGSHSQKLTTLGFVHLSVCKTIDIYRGCLPPVESFIFKGFKWRENCIASFHQSVFFLEKLESSEILNNNQIINLRIVNNMESCQIVWS